MTDAEKQQVSFFVTNIESPVFGYRNLPPVVVGTLFGRYSRSELGARELLLKEFLNNDEFKEIGEQLGSHDSAIDSAKAETFYGRVLDQYGDDSVAELGGTSISVEDVSILLSKIIEDRRIGLSPLEKSTRYVRFDQKGDDGHYRYFVDPDVDKAGLGKEYREVLDHLFDTYTELLPVIIQHLTKKFPIKEDENDKAYARAIRAQALDVVRYILPVATKTNLGLTGNGRAFEYLVYKLKASGLKEGLEYANMIQAELEKIIPAFLRRAKMDIGAGHINYLETRDSYIAKIGLDNAEKPNKKLTNSGVSLIDYEKDGEVKVAAALLYENTGMSFADCLKLAKKDSSVLTDFIEKMIIERKHRTHKPPRAFEHTSYQFDILCDIGAYRDLQRHRILTQQRQPFTTNLGYITPPDIIEAGVADKYHKVFAEADKLYQKLVKVLPAQAQYVVPFGYLERFTMRFNAREAYHLCELRSVIQGHPSYRLIAQEMARAIQKVHPVLSKAMMITWDGYNELARAASEQRLEKLHSS